MAFVFSGVFASAGAEVMEDFRRQFGGVGRSVETPFMGFAVRLHGVAVHTDADAAAAENDYAGALIKFSARHPAVTFVYVYAECFGGPCAYAGFVFCNGERVHDEPFRDGAEDYSVLSRLVAHLGVEAGGYFEPLARDYFEGPLARDGLATRAEGVRSWWRRLFGGTSGGSD